MFIGFKIDNKQATIVLYFVISVAHSLINFIYFKSFSILASGKPNKLIIKPIQKGTILTFTGTVNQHYLRHDYM